MLVMGISGGPFKTYEDGSSIGPFMCHDSSAVLLEDGEIVAAIETERLNRIKHTNKFPAEAIKFCLDRRGVRLHDLDAFAFYCSESGLDNGVGQWILDRYLRAGEFREYNGARSLMQRLLLRDFDYEPPQDRIRFVHHHLAHASSAFFPSGFDEGLVVSIDGQGDDESGRVLLGSSLGLETIATLTTSQSLGTFYVSIIEVLGFQQFEEFKAMGLAPYGDGGVFRERFRTFYTLLPDGGYALNWNAIATFQKSCRPRRRGEALTSTHSDIAAALQEALETIVLHVLAHFRSATSQRNLCMAGGVAHNCSLNGRIAQSGMFNAVFVQPAAHDAGCAYGAALSVHREATGRGVRRLRNLYWGTDCGNEDAVMAALSVWDEFIEVTKSRDICRETAELLAGGNVIGWVQGRSEFGPRALGNRSILADPRPADNKRRINEMVKKREGFRPFAPSVLEEHAAEYFEIDGDNPNLAYMIFVVKVRAAKQKLLGAVTHVDGTARVHTVSKRDNPRYWELLSAFKDITGVPVLLNTSFNCSTEPIVDSIDDAVVCFLTTNIDRLVAGNCLIRRRPANRETWATAVPSLPPYVVLSKTRRTDGSGHPAIAYECRNNFDSTFAAPVSIGVFDALMRCDGNTPLSDLRDGSAGDGPFFDELRGLWARRLVVLRPGLATARARTA